MTLLAPEGFSGGESAVEPIAKQTTGIEGLDVLTGGGLPAARLTTIIGAPGAGKTVFALQTLVHRHKQYGEACIFVAFEESIERIRRNIAAFKWHHGTLGEPDFTFIDARLSVDATISGAFDLSGLLAGLSSIQAATGAKNIVFDGIDMLLTGLRDEQAERVELTRVHEWIAASGLSAFMTAKSFAAAGRDQSRADFMQYITDCVIELADVKTPTAVSRTLRVSKYRGSGFEPNPFPCVIDETGFNVIVFKGARMDYPVYTDRLSSGVPRLDALLGGGYLRGSGILVSGAPGTAKSSLAASFVDAACAQGETTLLISFDENGPQIVRNMASIGIDLRRHLDSRALQIEGLLSSGQNAENHFIRICDIIRRSNPSCLVIDPISAFQSALHPFSHMVCECLLDFVKSRGMTVLCTSLLEQANGGEASVSQISTIADTWLHVSYVAHEGERNRALTIVKARGTSHSNQVRELVIGEDGISLVDVYAAEGAVLMGTARAQKEAELALRDTAEDAAAQRNLLRLERELEELSQTVRIAKMELEWKEREAAILKLADAERMKARRAAMDRRHAMRRVHDDVVVPAKLQNGGPS